MNQRSNFTSKIGFVLAAAGSAVGLGNLWRFPYLAAQYGGGTFLLVYLILAVTFGFALMIAEIGIGRKTGLSAIGAYEALNKKFGFVGVLTAAVPIIILPYYSVIGGWVIKYFATFISGSAHAAADDSYFGGFIGSPIEPIGWFSIFIALTALIVLCGVEKGIEKVSKVMMPILAVVRVANIDEAIEKAVAAEHGNRHSAHIHSKNVDNLTKFARAVETTIFVKNAPSYAGIGAGGEGYTTFTIAGPTGEGLTAAHSFTRQRRCVMVDGLHII